MVTLRLGCSKEKRGMAHERAAEELANNAELSNPKELAVPHLPHLHARGLTEHFGALLSVPTTTRGDNQQGKITCLKCGELYTINNG